jgi:hypothetical protein
MANISVRNQGRVRNHHNLACPAFAAVFVLSRALAYPCLTALFGLDKAEVTGSSPVSPITKKPC